MTSRRILLTGATGRLGPYVVRELLERGLTPDCWSGSGSRSWRGQTTRKVDLCNAEEVRRAFAESNPEIVIHLGAVSNVETCRKDPELARRVNVQAAGLLSELASTAGVRLVSASTDLVFDGELGNYREDQPAVPLSCYGRTKLAGELQVLSDAKAVVVRLALLYGPALAGRESFFDGMLRMIRSGELRMGLFVDEWRTPLDYGTAARGLVSIALHEVTGILHLGGPQRLSRFEMGQALAASLGARQVPFDRVTRNSVPGPEPRPRDVSLDSSQWRNLFPALQWPEMGQVLRDLV